MRMFLLGLVCPLLFSACGEPQPTVPELDETAPTRIETPDVPRAELGAWGIELNNMDQSIAPGDDFYRYMNGTWLQEFEIPADASNYGSFTVLFEWSEQRVRSIIEDVSTTETAPGSIEQKIGDFFKSYMDVDVINEKGLTPIIPDAHRRYVVGTGDPCR